MFKFSAKKTVSIILATVLSLALLTGCGEVNGNKTVLKVGDEKVSLGVANFMARYQQAMYESYYGVTESSWDENIDEDGTTYESSVKDQVMDSLEEMVLERQNASDYGIKLSKKEKKSIAKAAKKFLKANKEDAKEMTTATQEVVENYLELISYQTKVEAAIQDKIKLKDITDKEANQKKMQYVCFSFTSTDEDGNTTSMSDDEKKAVKKKATAFAKGVKDQADFSAYAKSQDQTCESATFDADSSDPDATLCKKADKLELNEVTGVIEGSTGYYVAKLVSLSDKKATKEKKSELLSEKQTKAVEKQIKKWKKATDIKVYKKRWAKVDFNKFGVSYADTSDDK